jgi:1-deoxy-D-xylulose-5-phosphate reductoisomerase
LFGSTGSIGTQAADIIARHPDRLKAAVLACGSDVESLARQIALLGPEMAVVAAESRETGAAVAELAGRFPKTRFLTGQEGLLTAAAQGDYDVMLNAVSGVSGLRPAWAALKSGRSLAMANKETLVAAGELVMAEAARRGLEITPVDSEHSAIFQALRGNEGNRPRKIILTASGGPFRGYNKEMLRTVTPEQALAHPNWSMGRKITVDSATMMNKGLEIIEAARLFGLEADRLETVVHPQSVIHSMVEFEDGAVMAQLGAPDMRAPIAYALSCPERWETGVARLDFRTLGALTFEAPDEEAFPCLRLAREALTMGGGYPTVLNAANEALALMFLEGRIGFTDIQEGVARALDGFKPFALHDVEEVLELDARVKKEVKGSLS